MSHDTRAGALPSLKAEPEDESGQRSIVLALMAMVVLLDQATKWWGWRHVSDATINSGGDFLVGPTVGGWYADPVTGALLDLLSFGFLSITVFLLVRRRRPAVGLASAALMIGGWSSNLLDRLGMHSWTAPGSVRGAVDFIPLGEDCYNLADVFIIGATLLLVLSVGYLHLRVTHRAATTWAVRPATHRPLRRRAWMSAFAGAVGLIVVIAIGAAHKDEMTAARTSTSTSAYQRAGGSNGAADGHQRPDGASGNEDRRVRRSHSPITGRLQGPHMRRPALSG